MFYHFYDAYYLLILVIPIIVHLYCTSVLRKYNNVRNSTGESGTQAAMRILNNMGISGSIPVMSSYNTSHYDPLKKHLNIEPKYADSASVTALAVAAHECGHAMQDAQAYGPLRLRNISYPLYAFGNNISYILIVIGLMFNLTGFLTAGIFFFIFVVAFQLLTLPVEFNASRRAVAVLSEYGMVQQDELAGVKKVLTACALTYVAGTITSILQLLRLIALSRRRR